MELSGIITISSLIAFLLLLLVLKYSSILDKYVFIFDSYAKLHRIPKEQLLEINTGTLAFTICERCVLETYYDSEENESHEYLIWKPEAKIEIFEKDWEISINASNQVLDKQLYDVLIANSELVFTDEETDENTNKAKESAIIQQKTLKTFAKNIVNRLKNKVSEDIADYKYYKSHMQEGRMIVHQRYEYSLIGNDYLLLANKSMLKNRLFQGDLSIPVEISINHQKWILPKNSKESKKRKEVKLQQTIADKVGKGDNVSMLLFLIICFIFILLSMKIPVLALVW